MFHRASFHIQLPVNSSKSHFKFPDARAGSPAQSTPHVVHAESLHTFHAIVGEAFTELIRNYEADAGWVIGAT